MTEITRWAPDVDRLTHAKRLTYDVATNWKNVIDNFLECYHCHIAHKEFVDLVDMDTYEVKTHGIWSSHFADAGKHENSAYDVSSARITQHAVWWLWPNTCLLRYPGRGNFMVFQVVPDGPDRTTEIWDFYRDEMQKLGRPDPGPSPIGQNRTVALAEDAEKGWAHMAPFFLHETNAYGTWQAQDNVASPYRTFPDGDALRASGQYSVLTPEQYVDELNAAPFPFAFFHPLCGGMPIDLAWSSLRLFEKQVMPAFT